MWTISVQGETYTNESLPGCTQRLQIFPLLAFLLSSRQARQEDIGGKLTEVRSQEIGVSRVELPQAQQSFRAKPDPNV
jgi:hypothetical protein